MHISSSLVWIFLSFAFVLIHARNIPSDFNEQITDDSSTNEQRRQIFYGDRHAHRTPLYPKKLFYHIDNELNYPYEHDRAGAFARRAKAITKGDPREFMG